MRKLTKPFWIFTIISIILVSSAAFAQEEEVEPTRKYVEISISGPLAEVKPTFAFPPRIKTIRSLMTRIDKIRRDDEVIGVLLKIEGLGIGWAKLQEIRDKIIQLRSDGKTVISYLEGGGNAEYMLACATDRIVLMPAGIIGLTGLRAEVMFYKGLLEKLDIEANLYAQGKYKSAIEPYTREGMSEAQREAINAILDDLYAQQIEMIASGRAEIDAEMAADLIDRGPFTAAEAHEAKLVDALQYYDELVKSVEADETEAITVVSDYGKKSKAAPDLTGFAGFMKLFSMLTSSRRPSSQTEKPKVALIYATGPIMSDTPTDPFTTGQVVTPGRVTKALREAREDGSIRAVVMRVDSPGGSALASDVIWREVMLTQREKPVVVSMSDVAGSGGYYIAMAAGAIVAEPGTITGSIGVLGGKLNLQGLYHKVGLTKEVITRGKNANLYSDYGNFTPAERERVETLLETIYQDFVRKAAKGRHKTEAEIREVAQGRIWTGRQAKEIGLVDELGGLDTALAIAKKRIALSPDDEIDIIVLPKPKTFFETLMEEMEMGVRLPITPYLSVPASVGEALQHFYWLRLFANEPVATVMPFEILIR
ncbi:MAG: signal peptide peptidase SppA [Candidatus Poribacteria bacterium]|nr:signal peptide peptidase SppA [Candidatus Poribacteria bacterium]